MISDTQFLSQADQIEARTLDRAEAQLGQLEQEKAKFNQDRAEAMKRPDYHPAFFNRAQRGITG